MLQWSMIFGGLTGSFAEYLSWLMGYETLCYALYDQTDLVTSFLATLNLAETETSLSPSSYSPYKEENSVKTISPK